MDGARSAAEALSQLLTARGLSVEALRFATAGTVSAQHRRGESSRARVRSAVGAPPPGAADEREIELGEVLGRGGMGVVSEATQRSLRRTVAVKQAISRDDDGADLAGREGGEEPGQRVLGVASRYDDVDAKARWHGCIVW